MLDCFKDYFFFNIREILLKMRKKQKTGYMTIILFE